MTDGVGGTPGGGAGWANPGWNEPRPDAPPPSDWGTTGPAPGSGPYGGWGPPPAPKPGVVPLRPLGLGEVLDGAITTVRRHPALTLGLAAIVVTVQQVLQVAVEHSTGALRTAVDPTTPFAGGEAAFGALASVSSSTLYAVQLLLSAVLGAVLTGMLVVVVGEAVLGREVRLADVWGRVGPRFWPLLGASLLSGLLPWMGVPVAVAVGLLVAISSPAAGVIVGVLLGILLLIVPGAAFWGLFALTTPALVLERLGPLAALKRSWQLVAPDFFRVWGIRALSTVLGVVISGVVAIPFSIASAVVGASSGAFEPGGGTLLLVLVIGAIGAIVAGTVVEPFLSGVLALLYIDRRIRAEGLDVQLQQAAREAAGRSAPRE